MPSATYLLFRQAILSESQVACFYNGRTRELCPHILGHKEGHEKVLAFQFGGETNSELPPGGEWRCLTLADVRFARMKSGAWHSGPYHRRSQSCIDAVDIDINIHVRKAP